MRPEEIRAQFILQKKTQKDLADKLGLHKAIISAVIYGQRRRPPVRKAIARELGIPVAKMFPDRA